MYWQRDGIRCGRRQAFVNGAVVNSLFLMLVILGQAIPRAAEAALFHVPNIENPQPPAQQLIDAVNAANVAGEPAVIEIEAGTYTFTQAADHIEGDNALPAITGDVTLRGLGDGAAQTIIQRDDTSIDVPKFRMMHVTPTGKLTLERLTLRGGETGCDDRCANNDHPMDAGGGVYVLGNRQNENGREIRGKLFVINSILRDNKSESFGGAIRNDGGYVEVVDSLIVANTTRYAIDGAGIYNDAHYKQHRATAKRPAIFGRLIVRRSTFAENIAGGEGAAIYNESGNVDISDSLIIANFARRGGGGISNGVGSLNVNNSTIYGNYTMGQGGGVLASRSNDESSEPALSRVKLNNVTVSGNVADGSLTDTNGKVLGGGGLALYWGYVELKNTIISGNSDPSGRECFTPLPTNSSRIGIISFGNNVIKNFSACTAHLSMAKANILATKSGMGAFSELAYSDQPEVKNALR